MWSNFWIEIHIINSQNVHKLLAVFSANGNQPSFRHSKYDVLLQYYQRYDKTLSTFAFLRIQTITYLTFTVLLQLMLTKHSLFFRNTVSDSYTFYIFK